MGATGGARWRSLAREFADRFQGGSQERGSVTISFCHVPIHREIVEHNAAEPMLEGPYHLRTYAPWIFKSRKKLLSAANTGLTPRRIPFVSIRDPTNERDFANIVPALQPADFRQPKTFLIPSVAVIPTRFYGVKREGNVFEDVPKQRNPDAQLSRVMSSLHPLKRSSSITGFALESDRNCPEMQGS